ncbi:hypothetical protein LCGC14_1071130 [marine sediment metagenome]|uniref:Homing endonuclease LAGLIDADG domain-containing protein n=1 Tax=marine sediment metagenome TaxID=412755 RepID=A0A0F9MN27_9ZZZZ
MREQPHYTNLLTEEFFKKYYIDKRMSYPKIREMLLKEGYNIHSGTLYSYAKKFNIGRDSSESRRNWDEKSLDYKKKYIQEDMIEFIDGFLLGDGGIGPNKNIRTQIVARFRCGVEYEDFCEYLMKPFVFLGGEVKKRKAKNMKQGYIFNGNTRHHPDIYQQYLRWYPENKEGERVKQPPEDVKITPNSVMMWYLGDGSVVVKKSSIMVRLSTDGFSKEKVEFLVSKLKGINIQCHLTMENRIMVNAKGVPAFFNFIGRKSPISCYNYKFDQIPSWRFEAKRMIEVVDELGVDYNRFSHLVKHKKIPCFRLSKNGRPRFLSEHISEAKKMLKNGILY